MKSILEGMKDTIFAKIIRREIPAEIVYEDEDTLAFLDIAPNNPGHTLVIPKAYARNVLDIGEEDWLAVMRTARTLARAVKDAVGADGVNLMMNNEAAAGQEVFHAHLHIIPRFTTDQYERWPKKEYGEGEKAAVAQMIRAKLP